MNAPLPANIFQGQAPVALLAGLEPEDLSEGIGSSYPILNYRGGRWSLRIGGETHPFVNDAGEQISTIEGVIVRQGRGKSKSFYPGGFDPDEKGKPPVCSSINGQVPDAPDGPDQAAERQQYGCGAVCKLCPHDAFKTQPNGRKGKACTDYKRLAFLILPTYTMKLFDGVALFAPVFLRVPPASLNSLAEMSKRQWGRGFKHPAQYFVRIRLTMDKSFPQMHFEELQPVKEAQAQRIYDALNDPSGLRITGEDQAPPALPAPTQAPAIAAPAPVVAPVAVAPAAPPPQAQPAPIVAQVAQAAASGDPWAVSATPAEIAAVASPSTITLAPEAAPVAPLAPAAQTVADIGETVPSDADLDARIAQLMAAAPK